LHDVEKVLAYITRERTGRVELLVFTQPAAPEAGVQVPAGTVDPGETPEQAVLREVLEESGLTGVMLAAHLRSVQRRSPSHLELRHVFHLELQADAPERWDHVVTGGAEDRGLVFSYYWLELQAAAEALDWMAEWLPLLRFHRA
jgi:8-oxo-dGTP diphosphatase